MFKQLILGLVLMPSTTKASYGDDQEEFQQCYKECFSRQDCTLQTFSKDQSLLLRLFYWDCHSECEYKCMWKVESANRDKGLPVYQYHGKWPFYRIFGIQEFFSSLFSMGNLMAHVYGFHRIYRQAGSGLDRRLPQWFLHGPILVSYLYSLNAWWWSTIFHARDTQTTMYLDYFSAMALLLTSLNLALVRAFNIHSKRKQLILAIFLGLFLFNHVRYMIQVKFNFGWNMKVAIIVGVAYLLLFSIWSVGHLAKGKRSHAKLSLVACLAGFAAASLELLDFSPLLGLLDAHALWHCATIPIILLWYTFFRQDALYDMGFSPVSKTIYADQ